MLHKCNDKHFQQYYKLKPFIFYSKSRKVKGAHINVHFGNNNNNNIQNLYSALYNL